MLEELIKMWNWNFITSNLSRSIKLHIIWIYWLFQFLLHFQLIMVKTSNLDMLIIHNSFLLVMVTIFFSFLKFSISTYQIIFGRLSSLQLIIIPCWKILIDIIYQSIVIYSILSLIIILIWIFAYFDPIRKNKFYGFNWKFF